MEIWELPVEARIAQAQARILAERCQKLRNQRRFCTDPRHDTPCPLPCQACDEECA